MIDGSGDVCELHKNGWYGILKEDDAEPWLLDGAEGVNLPATVLHEGVGA
ncbi:hypothetical protein GCM10025779_00550 [Arthrobacter cryoconiti]